MLRGVFVTGTDTGVGKTVAAAAILARMRLWLGTSDERVIRYWKPIQTGSEQDDDTAAVEGLSGCRPDEVWQKGVRLPRPVSPHLAARLSGQPISIDDLAHLANDEPASVRWIVEGAGGVLVPLDETRFMIDLMARLSLPVVVVARSTLGTINHTLLTLEALRHRALTVAGVIMVGEPNPPNRDAIEFYGRVPVIGELPRFDALTPEALGSWARSGLDPEDRWLARCFA